MQCWAKPPPEGKERRLPLCQRRGRKWLRPGLSRTQGLSKGSMHRPRALTSAPGRPLLPGGPGFPQSPWRREGRLSLTRPPFGSHNPKLTPHQRSPATCPGFGQGLSDALGLADGKAPTQSARHRWPQKAWMLGRHLSQGSGGTPLRPDCRICPVSDLEKSRENRVGRSHQALTFSPGRPGWPGFPLKPWKKKQELPRPSPQAEATSHSSFLR